MENGNAIIKMGKDRERLMASQWGHDSGPTGEAGDEELKLSGCVFRTRHHHHHHDHDVA